jgi:HEAT repeat protein
MLMRAETAEMARYALARIPGPAADEALRKALQETSGKAKIGIINSLGQRRDSKALPALSLLIASPDSQVADAAIYALGNIGGRAALDALGVVTRSASGTKRQNAVEAYLLCAGIAGAEGNRDDALKVYRQLNAASESETTRIAALRGLASVDARNSLAALAAALESKSPGLQAAAIRLLAGIPGKEATEAMVRHYPNLTPGSQVRLVTALGERGDSAARPVLLQATKSSTPAVQAAALAALGKLGDQTSVMVLAEAAASGKGPVQTAARESLAALRGASIDTTVIQSIRTSQGALKSEFILAAGERRSPEAAGVLTEAARDPDRDVRRAALRALRRLADPSQVNGLLKLVETADADDRSEAAQALAAALKKAQPAQIAPVLSVYRSGASPETRIALLEALGQTSSNEALPAVREGLHDSNPEIVRASILALTSWVDAAPLPDLLAAAKSRSEPALQTLAVRGCLKLLALPSKRSNSESARLVAEVIQLAKEPAEKRSALSQLTSYPSAEALKTAEAFLNDPAVAVEAKASVERIRSGMK